MLYLNSSNLLEKSRKIVLKKKNILLDDIIVKEESDKFISEFIKTEKLDNLYNMLEDRLSKNIILKASIIRYLFCFERHAFYSPIKKIFFSLKYSVCNVYEWIFKRILFETFLKRFFIKEIESYISFYSLFLKQYNIKNIFEIKDDAIVFDIGAWQGDTAYYFSKHCNNNAKIYCFEPDDSTFEILKNVCKKYNLNNTKQYNILFSNKATEIDFLNMSKNSTVKKNAITVDDFVLTNNIKKIDYIKMDVEGAEFSILEGAKNTIKKFRPSMAIAIYHGGDLYFEDLITVPNFIKEITPNYKYYIRSFSPWGAETILYCKPN